MATGRNTIPVNASVYLGSNAADNGFLPADVYVAEFSFWNSTLLDAQLQAVLTEMVNMTFTINDIARLDVIGKAPVKPSRSDAAVLPWPSLSSFSSLDETYTLLVYPYYLPHDGSVILSRATKSTPSLRLLMLDDGRYEKVCHLRTM